MLYLIIERKRLDDQLMALSKMAEFHEQKFRLRRLWYQKCHLPDLTTSLRLHGHPSRMLQAGGPKYHEMVASAIARRNR